MNWPIKRTKKTEPSRALVRDQQGNVFAEYIIVLGTAALVIGLAIYSLGVPLVRSYYIVKLFVLLPIP